MKDGKFEAGDFSEVWERSKAVTSMNAVLVANTLLAERDKVRDASRDAELQQRFEEQLGHYERANRALSTKVAEYEQMLRDALVVYACKTGPCGMHLWEEHEGTGDTHSARLVDIREIKK